MKFEAAILSKTQLCISFTCENITNQPILLSVSDMEYAPLKCLLVPVIEEEWEQKPRGSIQEQVRSLLAAVVSLVYKTGLASSVAGSASCFVVVVAAVVVLFSRTPTKGQRMRQSKVLVDLLIVSV